MVKKQLIKVLKNLNSSRFKNYKNKFNNILGQRKISFIDIGASIQIIPRWKRIDKKNLDYILFEPNAREAKKLENNKKFYEHYKVYRSILSNKNCNLKLNITKGIYQSSVLKPNYNFINQFQNPGRYKINKKISLKAKKLDDFKLPFSDFIKVDTQGYNYEILEGSINTLKNSLGVECETEFAELYSNQKLFGDVNNLLKKNNFEFIDFTTLRRWNRYNLSNYGQCVFGNALFLKKPEFILNLSKDKVIKYIAICALYNKFDIISFIMKNTVIGKKEKNIIKDNIKFLKSYSQKSRNIRAIASIVNRSIDFESEVHLFQ